MGQQTSGFVAHIYEFSSARYLIYSGIHTTQRAAYILCESNRDNPCRTTFGREAFEGAHMDFHNFFIIDINVFSVKKSIFDGSAS